MILFLVFSVPEKFRKPRDSEDALSRSRVYTRKKKKFTNTINNPRKWDIWFCSWWIRRSPPLLWVRERGGLVNRLFQELSWRKTPLGPRLSKINCSRQEEHSAWLLEVNTRVDQNWVQMKVYQEMIRTFRELGQEKTKQHNNFIFNLCKWTSPVWGTTTASVLDT